MANMVHLRKYGVQTTIDFEVFEVDGVDLRTDWTPAAADCEVMKDEGASTQCTNTATDEGSSYSIVLTATEMEAARLVLKIVDAATKVFLDKVIIIETYGHASAMHAMDLDDSVRGGLTALPNAAVNAAGGLVKSTAGGVDMDALAADAARLTAVRAAVLTDWINDGRLDVILDAIPTTAMRGTDSAALATTAAKLLYGGPRGPGAYLDDAAANTNTVIGTDGIPSNPVSTIAAAKTVADALGTKRIYLIADADITLAATMEEYEFIGIGELTENILNLGSQDVDLSSFYNLTIEGTQGGTQRIYAEGCALRDPGAGTTTLHIFAYRCGIIDDISVDTSADNIFDACFSLVAGTAAPVITATGAAGTISVRHFSGGIEFKSLSASHNVSVEADGQVIFNADCNVNATVVLRGSLSITDNTAGMDNLTVDAVSNKAETAKGVLDRVNTGANHNIVNSLGRQIRETKGTGDYVGGAVWVDTVGGAAGTTLYENGTFDNPSDSIANARTIADALGSKLFRFMPGSSDTLAEEFDGYEFCGYGYTIALGGQSVSGALFFDATITGNDDGSNGTATAYIRCVMGNNTLGKHVMHACQLAGDLVLAEAADYFWDACYSGIAGTATPSVDFESAAETKNLSIRHYSGGMEFKNHGAGSGTHKTSLEGRGQIVLNASCAGGTIAIRGPFTKTDNAGGAVTLSDDARLDIGQINAQVVDVLKTDTVTLPGQGAPTATPTIEVMIAYLYKVFRNKKTQDATEFDLYDDAGTTVDQKATTSESAGTVTQGELVSGP